MTDIVENGKSRETQDIEACILYIDVVKSTGVAQSRDLASYHRLIEDFQHTVHRVITSHLTSYRYKPLNGGGHDYDDADIGEDYEWAIEGDEARVFLYSGDQEFDLRSAVLLGIKIKLAFLTCDLNQQNLSEGRPPIDLAIGMHIGRVLRVIRPWHRGKDNAAPRIEGISISKAKKVMDQARLGYFSKIAASYEAVTRLRELRSFPCHFAEHHQMKLETAGENESLYELVGFFDHEVYWYLPSDMRECIMQRALEVGEMYRIRRQFLWLNMILMRYFLDKGALNFRKEQELSKVVEYGSSILKEYGNESVGYLHYFICMVHNMLGISYKTMAANTHIDLYLEKAREEFEAALVLDAENAAANYHLGLLYEESGNDQQALRNFQAILVRDPYNPDATVAEERVRRRLHSK